MDRRIMTPVRLQNMDFEKELSKLDDDLLKGCRLTQEAIGKTSGLLMHFDAEKAQEVTDYGRKIVSLCGSSEDYFAELIETHKPEAGTLRAIEAGVGSLFRLRQIANLTQAIVTDISGLNGELPDSYRINASQFAKIIQNIVWDSVFARLKKDAGLANKTINTAQQLATICLHTQENLLKTQEGTRPDNADALIFIAQCMKNIAAYAADIAVLTARQDQCP